MNQVFSLDLDMAGRKEEVEANKLFFKEISALLSIRRVDSKTFLPV